MGFRRIGTVLVLGSCCLTATAQMAMGSDGGAAKLASPASAVDVQLGQIEGEMMAAVKAMPAEKFGFAPSAAIFVPGQTTEFATVRTFAQQAIHVAQANYWFYSSASGMKPDVDTGGLSKLTKKDDIVAALAASFAFGHKAIATLTAANAFEVVQLQGPGVYTRATIAESGAAHANDHYGQLVEYLRMNGVVPPASTK